ncbi:MAG: L-lactate permease [Phycisphaerae bacterium]|jgi:lactate permease
MLAAVIWSQVYDPLNSPLLSTLCAAVPIVVLLGTLAFLKLPAHVAAMLGLAAALGVAIGVFGMPADRAAASAVYGAAFGLLPIGWIIVNVIFLYALTEERGLFEVLKASLTGVTRDRRLQLLLIAFCFGAFFEGAAGFGTPVAVTAAILIGLGFKPLAASGLSLIANTAPVAYGGLGTPIIALHSVTGLDVHQLSAMVGRQLPFFSIIVPFWLVAAFAGWRGMLEVWPALLVAGAAFAVPQFLVSNLHGPWLVDIVASVCSMAALTLFLLVWHPRRPYQNHDAPTDDPPAGGQRSAAYTRAQIRQAWTPWIILSLVVFVAGFQSVKKKLDSFSAILIEVPRLHNLVQRVPPVVAEARAEEAVYKFNWLSATGTAIFAAAVISGLLMGFSPRRLLGVYRATLWRVRYSLLTVTAMLALGYVTKCSGLDATLGLAFSKTGVLYPFFGTLLGWLGVALTGSDTSSNVLFGSLQTISARQVGVSAVLMAAANSSGGVMGKMIDAQSIVVASTATRWYGHEGDILRYVFVHSLLLACLVGLLVLLQAYVWPFSAMVIGG